MIAVGLHPPGQVPVTVTEKLQLPPAVAVQVTVVVPIGKNDPDGGEQLTVPHVPLVVGAGYVTIAPHCPGPFGCVISAGHVNVHGATGVVIMLRHQPPAMIPPSPAVSSITYRLHTPFGFVPLNTFNADPPDGTGAGGGNTSVPPSRFVGLNVPDTSGPIAGRFVAAASSSVNVTPLTDITPPTSDMMMAFWPPGPTTITSTSSGNVCPKLFSVTVTWLTTPVWPTTVMFDGYGVAAPPVLIVIGVGLHTFEVSHVPVTVTEKLQLPPAAAVQVTVVVPIGKNDPDGGEQVTVPHVPVVVGAG